MQNLSNALRQLSCVGEAAANPQSCNALQNSISRIARKSSWRHRSNEDHLYREDRNRTNMIDLIRDVERRLRLDNRIEVHSMDLVPDHRSARSDAADGLCSQRQGRALPE